jgi:GSCFA family
MSNPYRGLPDRQFWSRAMTWPAPGHIDPAGRARRIGPGEKVGTLGSCFAQHLARFIARSGLEYFVPESAPAGMATGQAKAHQYGVFSARYGNVYTVRQALQLFDRAFGVFAPAEDVWEREGGFVDAFRPQIDPAPSPTAETVRRAAEAHLSQVRRVFTESRHLVFTLGLTEGWRSRIDGAVFPVAPGVAGGSFDPARHEFVNFTAAEVAHDLAEFITRVEKVNPDCHVILTVSPVALIATYEPRHVWVSTTFSKAALRVAADAAERRFDNVTYFPSYEIITSPAAAGRYYADDLRQVTDLGVGHVMRVFTRHFITGEKQFSVSSSARTVPTPARQLPDIVCDEEVIEKALARSGLSDDDLHRYTKEAAAGPRHEEQRMQTDGLVLDLRIIEGIYCVETVPGQTIPIKNGAGVPLGRPGTIGDGWEPQFVYTGFAPVYLLEFRRGDGQGATWYLDPDMRAHPQRDLPSSVRSLIRQKAGPLFLQLWNDLLCPLRPTIDMRLRALCRINRRTVGELVEMCAPALPVELAAVNLAPLRGRDRALSVFNGSAVVEVRSEQLLGILGPIPAMPERMLGGLQDTPLTWPSPVDGSSLSTDNVLCLGMNTFAFRVVEPRCGLVFYVVATGDERRASAVLFPAAQMVFCPDAVSVERHPVPNLGMVLLKHLCEYGDGLEAYLQAPRRNLTLLIHGHHHGHLLFEDLAGIDELLHRSPAGRLPQIFMREPGGPSEAGETFGKLEALFPAFEGKVRRFSGLPALIRQAYSEHRSLVRVAPQHVTRRLAERVVEVNTSGAELDPDRRLVEAIKAKGWPIVLLDLRIENRTLVDLPAFCAHLVEFLIAETGGAAIVFGGHTGSYESPMDAKSKRSPLDAQKEITAELLSKFAQRSVELVDIVGTGMKRAIFWSHHADFFIAPWGASLVLYRWLCNKPGLIMTSQWNLEHGRGPGTDIYSTPRFMESPTPVAYLSKEHVEDAPDAPMEFWTDHASSSMHNFRVDESAVFDEVRRLLAEFARAAGRPRGPQRGASRATAPRVQGFLSGRERAQP